MVEKAATPLAWAASEASLAWPYVPWHVPGHLVATPEANVEQDEQLLRPCLLPNQSPGAPHGSFGPIDSDVHEVRHEAAVAEERHCFHPHEARAPVRPPLLHKWQEALGQDRGVRDFECLERSGL